MDEQKACPFCAEQIPATAIVCPFCRTNLPDAHVPAVTYPSGASAQVMPAKAPPPTPPQPPEITTKDEVGSMVVRGKRGVFLLGASGAALILLLVFLLFRTVASRPAGQTAPPSSPLPVQAATPAPAPTTSSSAPSPTADTQGAAEANRRGAALAEGRRYDEAIQAFVEAIHLDPRMTGAWANRAHALLKLGRLDEAAMSANKALELSTVPKTRAVAYLALGFIAVKRGKIREAETAYQEALGERFDYPAAQDALRTLNASQHPTPPLLAAVKVALSGQGLAEPLIIGLSRPERLILAAAPSARHGLPLDDPSVANFYYTTHLPLEEQLKEDPAASQASLTPEDRANEQKVRESLMAESRSARRRR